MNDNQKALELILKDVAVLGDKMRKLESAIQRQAQDVNQSVLTGLLDNGMLKLTREQREVIKAMMDSRGKQAIQLYVQPDEFNSWQSSGRNLLTISRTNVFPFTIPLTVVI